MMKWGVVIAAGGTGTRFGRPKQLLPLGGHPMVAWSMRTLSALPEVAEMAIVTEDALIETMRGLAHQHAPGVRAHVVQGGEHRQGSVERGVRALSDDVQGVLVHDGARPFVRVDDVVRAMAEVREGRASVLGVPVVDTIKRVDEGGIVRETVDRTSLVLAQTPQCAMRARLLQAYDRARATGFVATDDVALVEYIGDDVVVVSSSPDNFKVTYPEDYERACARARSFEA